MIESTIRVEMQCDNCNKSTFEINIDWEEVDVDAKSFEDIIEAAHKKAKEIAWYEENWSHSTNNGVENNYCPSCAKKIEKAMIKK